MRQAGRIVRRVLNVLTAMAAPGVTTKELDAEAERLCLAAGAECLFKGVPGRGGAGPFPGCICASMNEQVVHGIPSARAIRNGDLVSLDFGVRVDGWCGDAAVTIPVGNVMGETRRLAEVTRHALEIATSMIRPGERWSRVARAMQSYVEGQGYSVVREFVGHGIGSEMWEDPKLPNFVSRELEMHDIVLAKGMVLAVEPMVNMGSPGVEYEADGWTVVTRDRLPSAHFEDTLAVTGSGVRVLTAAKDEVQR